MCVRDCVNDPNCIRPEERAKRREGVRQHARPVTRQGRAGAPPARARRRRSSECPVAGYKPWSGTSIPGIRPPANLTASTTATARTGADDGPRRRACRRQTPPHYCRRRSSRARTELPLTTTSSTDARWANWHADACTVGVRRSGPGLRMRRTGRRAMHSRPCEAQYEPRRNGRGNVQDVIIFLSDGAANTMPQNVPQSHWSNSWTAGWTAAMRSRSGRRRRTSRTPARSSYHDRLRPRRRLRGAPEQVQAARTQPGHAEHLRVGLRVPAERVGDGSAQPCNAFAAIQAMATDPTGLATAVLLQQAEPR